MKNYSKDIANKEELDVVKTALEAHNRRLNVLTWAVIGFAVNCLILQVAIIVSTMAH